MRDKKNQKYFVHFSCGVPSAVAVMLAFDEFGYDNVRVIYCDTGSENPDNKRFMNDVEDWLGFDTEVIKSAHYSSVSEVIAKTGWIAGVGGARCTSELKRIPAENLINYGRDQEIEILGYTIEEKNRVDRWIKNNNERKIDPILIRNRLSKVDCQGIIERAGIDRPAMYNLGYQNNNCVGCVKGQAGYWNKIRVDFPWVFLFRSIEERRVGAAICKVEARAKGNGFDWPDWVYGLSNFEDFTVGADGKRARLPVYLDELPYNYGNYPKEVEIQCGFFCMMADQ